MNATGGQGICQIDAEGRVVAVDDAARSFFRLGDGDVRGELLHDLAQASRFEPCDHHAAACPLTLALRDAQPHTQVWPEHDQYRTQLRLIEVPLQSAIDRTGALLLVREENSDIRAEQAFREYLLTASHEIRNPLTAVIALAGWLSGRISGGASLDAPVEEVVETLAHESRQIERLVNLFLDDINLDDVMRPRVRKQPVDIAALVWEEGQAEWRRNPHVDLKIEGPAGPSVISTDPLRVREVLVNLLGNAAKYGGSSPQVTMSLTLGPTEACIEVRDRGPGIAPEEQALIFDQAYRGVRDAAVGKPGVGMGLFISREIVSALGGRLELRSAVGHGSTFSFVLPAVSE